MAEKSRFLDRLSERGVPVTRTFELLCVAATGAAMFAPGARAWLSGSPREQPWQALTAAFVHGTGSLPAWLHLLVYLFLFDRIAAYAERLLGSRAFAGALALGLLANAVLVRFADFPNGSGLFVWLGGPTLWATVRIARRIDPAFREDPGYRDLGWVLILFWVVVPLVLTLTPYVAGWRGSPVTAFAFANLPGFAGTALGFAVAGLGWRGLEARIAGEGNP
ncbi:MAG: hypothetical protein R3B81_04010 [bacterium]